MKRTATFDQGFRVVTAEFDPARMIGRDFHYPVGERAVFAERTIDISKAEYLSCLKDDEGAITGVEKMRRLKKSRRTVYNLDLAMGLWKDYQRNPAGCVLERIFEDRAITHIFFMGDVIEDEKNVPFVVYFCRSGEHHWKLLARVLSGAFSDHCFTITSPAP